MKCKQCGFVNQEGSVFCSKCGTRLAYKCPNCGETVLSGSRFCNYCGYSLVPADRTESIPEKPVVHRQDTSSETVSSKPKQTSFRIIISVICAIAAVVIIIIGISKQSGYYWDQEELIGYFIGFMIFGIGALVAYKTELVTKAKNAGIILIIIGILVFLFGVVCSGFYRHKFSFDNIEWDDIQINFYIGLIILAGGLFLCLLNRDKEHHSDGRLFSFRRVGSILVIGLSLLYIILILSGVDELDDWDASTVIALIIYLSLLVVGILGFNAKDAKYGKIVIVLTTIILFVSLFGVYSYNKMIKDSRYYSTYKMKYSGPLFMYVIILLPAIFMCITPKHLKDDGRVLYYCKKCDKFWEGDSDTSNTYCPECGEDTMNTHISARKYENMTDSEIKECKKWCIARWWDED